MNEAVFPDSPSHLWRHFREISKIPRPSGQEQAVREYIIDIAKLNELEYIVDATGNLVVYVPASKGYEHAETVAIQNHLDMVTVKTADKDHDFDTDPICLQVKGRWLTADRTTLGADNGVGVAAALAVLTDPSTVHPRLELVFTVEEETGLYGALGLEASNIQATRMINLDTEDWGEIFIGCAGGYGYEASREFPIVKAAEALVPWRLHLKGLAGGHSGVQIHEQLGNANRLLTELLIECRDLNWALAEFNGGVAHNVIAREAYAIVYLEPAQQAIWQQRLQEAKSRWQSYLPDADQSLNWVFEPCDSLSLAVLSECDRDQLLDIVSVLPHGAQSYSLVQPADLVDLSCNLACIVLRDGVLSVQTSIRYFNEQEVIGLKNQIEAIFRAFALTQKIILDYPSWNPDFNSALVARAAIIAEKITGTPPRLRAIHAGLECGILTSKKPGMDVVSFGPTIRGAHSPTERLEISTIEPFWKMLQALLAELAVV